MGGAKYPGCVKEAAVTYYDPTYPTPIPIKYRQAKEGQDLRFDVDVLSITYGPITITSPNIYLAMLDVLMKDEEEEGGTFPVNGNSLGGDPNFWTVKTCTVIYRKGGEIKEVSAEDGDVLRFS